MNILTKVTWRSMRRNKTRTLVTVIGIILSAAMFTAVVTLGISLWDFLVRGEIHNQGDYFIQYDYITDEEIAALSEDPDITSVADLQISGVLKLNDKTQILVAACDQRFYDTMPTYLLEGRLPANSSEIVLPRGDLSLMQVCGLETEIGKTVTFQVDTDLGAQTPEHMSEPMQSFTATYTIVGYVDGNMYTDYDLLMDHMLTFADGEQGSVLWHRAFVKTHPRKIMDVYDRGDADVKGLHTTLCGLYGATEFDNVNQVLLGVVITLSTIIMVGSVSLIYNAFSISISERTKQFGLLVSIGATKKQMRRSVYTEALTLCVLGIPPGVLAGYWGIWCTLKLLAPRINQSLSMAGGAVTLRALFSPVGLVIAAIIALITVLISAAIPAMRATRISPMEALRQIRDYRQLRKARKLSKVTLRLFGLPGALGKAYYTVSRGKYRTTVISLVISFVLFVSAASFSQTMQNTAQRNFTAQSFDISVRADLEDMEQLRSQPFVKKAAYERQAYYSAFTPDEQLSDAFLKYWDELEQYYKESGKNVTNMRIFYLEDFVLQEYLVSHGISPEPYFDPDCPRALVCKSDFAVYANAGGEYTRFVYQYHQFSEKADRLQLFNWEVPEELLTDLDLYPSSYVYEQGPNGELLLVITYYVYDEVDPEKTVTYQLLLDTDTPGQSQVSYCLYDWATGMAQDPIITQTCQVPIFCLGDFIEELPYGIPSGATEQYFYTSLILPLSLVPETAERDTILHISVSDYPAAAEYMSSHFAAQEYQDIHSSEEYNRTLLLVINVFSYGFIILISLISIANVFNTISTNVALRRRDFGILRGVGFREKDLVKMMRFECVNYGLRALILSIPLSIPISYLIWQIDNGTYNADYTPPWFAMLIGALSIFCVVFSAMSYSVSKIRKDNPIEAIRMDSI